MHQILISRHFCTFCSSFAVDGRTRLLYLCFNHEQQGTMASVHVELACCRLIGTLRSGKEIELLIYLDFVWYLELWNSSSPPEQSWISGTFQNSLLLLLFSSKLVEFPKAVTVRAPWGKVHRPFYLQRPQSGFNWHQLRVTGAFCSFIFALGRIISDSEPVDFLCDQHLFCLSYQFEALLCSSFGTFMSVLKPTLNRLVVLFPLWPADLLSEGTVILLWLKKKNKKNPTHLLHL